MRSNTSRTIASTIDAAAPAARGWRAVQALVATALVVTSIGATTAEAPSGVTEPSEVDEVCVFPHPCDYAWDGPEAPFAVRPVERLRVGSFDGVTLNGWLFRPDVSEDVPVPVVFVGTPYIAQGETPTETASVGGVPTRFLVEHGYAVAFFSVRGTGDSGGCLSFFGSPEQQDQAFLIEWLAAQSWSNGRVAMTGNSYVGTTPVEAAIQNPPSLKTIIISGTVLDFYSAFYSPQGAEYTAAQPFLNAYTAQFSLAPGVTPGDDMIELLGVNLERACDDLVAFNTAFYAGRLKDVREPEFMTERRFIDHVPGIRSAVFVVHGFLDRYGSVHAFQEDWAWEALDAAPKRMLVGQWWHEFPNRNSVNPEWSMDDWPDRLLQWLDYWLKGWGDEAPGLGEVEFQDSSGAWHRSKQWPPSLQTGPTTGPPLGNAPAHRRDEVAYLAGGAIQPQPAAETATYVSLPPPYMGGTSPHAGHPDDGSGVQSINSRSNTPCPDPTRLVYLTPPLTERTVLAGNPHAWLSIESSEPGGIVDVQLFDVPPTFTCPDPDFYGVRPITEGSADLRFHRSTDYVGRDFPTATPEHVRVDLANLADVIEVGHRLGVVISSGSGPVQTKWSPGHQPQITLHGDGGPGSSHLVLPVIAGGFGGSSPTLAYPPRPFTPE